MSFLLRGFDGTLSQRVYWTSTALDDSQYTGPGPISDLVVMEVVEAGGGVYDPAETWTQIDVAANQTNVALSTQVSQEFDSVKMTRSGSIVGLSTRLTEAITAGTLTVEVTINGSPTSLVLVHTSGTGSQFTQAAAIDSYVAGDLVGIRITTDAGFLPNTTDLEAYIQVFEGTPVPTFTNPTWLHAGGRETHVLDTPVKIVSGFEFDRSQFVFSAIKFRAVGARGNTVNGIVELYNTTDAVSVATLTFTSTSPALQESLDIAGSLPPSSKLYEIRIYLAAPFVAGDSVELYSAYLNLLP